MAMLYPLFIGVDRIYFAYYNYHFNLKKWLKLIKQVGLIQGLEKSLMNYAINSPFRYPGGKFYARNLILEYIPHHTHYIEPFVGGGSIFFAKEKINKNWLNDVDQELINCYLIIRDQPDNLIEKLKGEQATKERHTYYKNEYQPTNYLEKAVRWFYLNRTSYSGIMKRESCYWGYGDKYSMKPENWPRNILRTSQKLQNVRITNLDFEEVFNEVEDGAFLFIDPPYFNARQDNFYTHHFTQDDHFRLCETLKFHSKRLKFLLTYDNVSEIRELYEWASQIDEKEWNYTVGRTDDQKKNKDNDSLSSIKKKGSRYKGKEIFITNYGLTELNLTYSYQQLELPLYG
jgi:DNA adenine methylase